MFASHKKGLIFIHSSLSIMSSCVGLFLLISHLLLHGSSHSDEIKCVNQSLWMGSCCELVCNPVHACLCRNLCQRQKEE